MSTAHWETVIGLEVHCRLGTRTKLFCGCLNIFGAEPNTHTCAVCSAQPGALPVLNEQALVLALRAALALGAEVAEVSRFDRKNYFYCDLPKGYQITQLFEPYSTGGGVTLENGRCVRLTRIHIEEDAGKSIHDWGERSLVDLNRAGVPLIEIVSEADMRSAGEAEEYLQRLREILRFARVSDCDMEKGSLRCDVNVSVRPVGGELRTRVELKNLNSFRHIVDSIAFEVDRQRTTYAAGNRVVQETRLFDAQAGVTRTMRTKENEDDYRYFPDPDLPPAVIDAELIERERAALPVLPEERRKRYIEDFGLSKHDACVLTSERALADFFEGTVEACGDAKAALNWIANDLLAATSDESIPGTSIAGLRIDPAGLALLLKLVAGGKLHRQGAKQVLTQMLRTGATADDVARELELEQISDDGTIEAWCRSALEGQEQVITQVRKGKTKALGALIGPIMKASGGRANPGLVRETLLRMINGGA